MSTSGADIAIAAGTIAAAGAASAGLLVSLVINKLDRDRADKQARDDRDQADQRAKQDRDRADERGEQDRKAAFESASTDRALAREDTERRHIVDLLLELGRQVATFEGMQGSDQARVARQQITLLLNALPPECASTVRKKFGGVRTTHVPGAIGTKQQYLKVGHLTADQLTTKEIMLEISYDIDRYMTSGVAPAEAWRNIENLEQWQREHWPQ